MKKHFLIAATAVVFLLALIGVLVKRSDGTVRVNDLSHSYGSIDETKSLDVTLNILLNHESIPVVPLKDLFSQSDDRDENKQNVDYKNTRKVSLENPAETKRVTTTPRLLGIVIRKSGARAFFVEDDKTYSLTLGDTLAGRYKITSIGSDRVNIREISTGLSRYVYIKDE